MQPSLHGHLGVPSYPYHRTSFLTDSRRAVGDSSRGIANKRSSLGLCFFALLSVCTQSASAAAHSRSSSTQALPVPGAVLGQGISDAAATGVGKALFGQDKTHGSETGDESGSRLRWYRRQLTIAQRDGVAGELFGSSVKAQEVPQQGSGGGLPFEAAGHGVRVGGPPPLRAGSPVRPHKFDITDFGAKGDGATDNTRAFQNALYAVSTVADKGGGQLYVPPGRWLTACFNLTSNMTLFLAKGAVLLANPDLKQWPLLPPLPSYGRGREMPGPRYSSLIYGQNLTDIIITGENGTVDGQGAPWWSMARGKTLGFSRGALIEILWSSGVTVANISLLNSPYWALHPAYCNDVAIQGLTITAPSDSPNTAGICPDSSSRVEIQGCRISTGDDCIDIKSGWDEYGVVYNRSSSGIVVRDCDLHCSNCSALSIGSEMSGGVENVLYENIRISASSAGFRLKTSPGRGGYVVAIKLKDVVMSNVGVALSFLPMYGEHADDNYNISALPLVADFTFENVTGCQIAKAGVLEGLPSAPFRNINISHVHLDVVEGGEHGFSCRDVSGTANDVTPPICDSFKPGVWPSGVQEAPMPRHPAIALVAALRTMDG